MRGLCRGEKEVVRPRWGSWRRWVRVPAVAMRGKASTTVAARSRREVHWGAVVRCFVGEPPGTGCQRLSVGVLRFQ